MLKYTPVLAALPLLAACASPDVTATPEAPNVAACRESAAAAVDATIDETSAQPVGTDMSGVSNLDVSAGGKTFRCVVDANGNVESLIEGV